MIRRLYVNNFRCLQNFELRLDKRPSSLLIGKNGSGKSSIRKVLDVFRRIALGTNRIRDLVGPGDAAWAEKSVPLRFELEVDLGGALYSYSIALELPPKLRELKVAEETLLLDGRALLSRNFAQVELPGGTAHFAVDPHLLSLPIISERSDEAPIFKFRKWLARMLILAPLPALMTGESSQPSLMPEVTVQNYGDWLTGLLTQRPAAYASIQSYVSELLPEFDGLDNRAYSEDHRSLLVMFKQASKLFAVPFGDLSDGEKCIFVSALVNAAFRHDASSFCFWDEPDNHLAPSEVGHFVMDLRKVARSGNGQMLLTSHNPEAIRQFSNDNTFLLYRASYLEPAQVRTLDSLESAVAAQDLIGKMLRGELQS